MTTPRQKAPMLAAILGLSAWCGWEAMGLHLWNTLAFGLMAVACAAMFVVQVGEEKQIQPYKRHGVLLPADGLFPHGWYVPYRRMLLRCIRDSRNWTWRVKR